MNDVIYILTFHGLGIPERRLPDAEERFWLGQSSFEAILDRIKTRTGVCLTFDDCNSSDFNIALPALLRRQLRGLFFVVTERVGLPGFLSPEQIRELVRAGMSVGSHGTKHRPWAELGPVDLHEEIETSRKQLADLIGRPIEAASCPFGSYNRKVLADLRTAGYRAVYTSDGGPARGGDWVLPRNTITRSTAWDSLDNLLQSRSHGLAALGRRLRLACKRLK